MGQNTRNIIIVVAILTVGAALTIPFFQSLERKSLRAEVRVMLNYMATLQQAYHTDTGRYAFFEDPYGGPVRGEEKCHRPLGAEELGFKLKGCKKGPDNGGLRYYYQALKIEIPGQEDPTYLGRGTSASNIKDISYVCKDSKAEDVWEIGPGKGARQVKDCE